MLSGGVDSAACLAYYLKERFSVEPIFIDYGQIASSRELRAAKAICDHFRTPLTVVTMRGVAPKGPGVILGRNALLLLVALMECDGRPQVVAIGVHSGTRYRDCSPPFIKAMQQVLDIYAGGSVQLGAPFLMWRKQDIWRFAQENGVPLRLTYSCERGFSQPCRSCDSCRDLEALGACSKQ